MTNIHSFFTLTYLRLTGTCSWNGFQDSINKYNVTADEIPDRRQTKAGRITGNICQEKEKITDSDVRENKHAIPKSGHDGGLFKHYFGLTMEEAFKPGTKPIKTAMVTVCDQVACSKIITFVSTATSIDTAIRISQGRTIDLWRKETTHVSLKHEKRNDELRSAAATRASPNNRKHKSAHR